MDDLDILSKFRDLIPPKRRFSGTGWTNFDCPSCGDRRGRGGFNFTDTGGFRFFCFNGGCEYNINPTGWEPGEGIGGRPRRLFESLGGDIKDLPLRSILKGQFKIYSADGEVKSEGEELQVEYKFSKKELPDGTVSLINAARYDKCAKKVLYHLHDRIGDLAFSFNFLWCPDKVYYYIIPFYHYNTIVGYLGRHIYVNKGPKRFFGSSPPNYMFNQHLISKHQSKYLFVVESPLDAISMDCLASRSDRLTHKQINLLKISGKDIVLIPDRENSESRGFIETAEENKWFLSIPDSNDWGDNTIKDVSDSVKSSGLLYTIETLMKSTTRNYINAKNKMTLKDRSW